MDAGYAAVQRLVSDAGLRARQGANGRRLSRDEFSAEASTQTLLNLYSTVCDSVSSERLVQRAKPVGIPIN
jgi:glycosyltransferase involved in cell wall biosynthesis